MHGLVPGALAVEVRPLGPEDALLLLARVAWDAEAPLEGEREAARRLVERLGHLPLAIELAGATLRNLVTAEEYLASLRLGQGVAASDREWVHVTLTRSLADLGLGDERALLALGVLPAAGATGEMVATTLGEEVPPVTRRLDRLVRHNLAGWSAELGRYVLHPLVREAARERAKAQSMVWDELHLGAAAAIEALMGWIYASVGTNTDRARERWASVHELFDAVEPGPWYAGAPGGDLIAWVIAGADGFRTDRTFADRKDLLAVAEELSQGGKLERRARVLLARGELRRLHVDLEGASKDYDEALALYKEVDDRQGQAHVLRGRADLRRRRDDLEGASEDYDEALGLYKEVDDRPGQAHVLRGRADLRHRRADLEGASEDYDEALGLYKEVNDLLGQANVLLGRGGLERGRNNLPAARNWYEQALPIYRAVGGSLGLGNVLAELARVHQMQGNKASAMAAATEAAELAAKSKNAYAANLAADVLAWARPPEEEA